MTSTRPSSSAVRTAVTKTPVPPMVASGALLTSPSVLIEHQLAADPGGGQPVGDVPGLGGRQRAAAGARAAGPGSCRNVDRARDAGRDESVRG